jgi:hypothetical protein
MLQKAGLPVSNIMDPQGEWDRNGTWHYQDRGPTGWADSGADRGRVCQVLPDQGSPFSTNIRVCSMTDDFPNVVPGIDKMCSSPPILNDMPSPQAPNLSLKDRVFRGFGSVDKIAEAQLREQPPLTIYHCRPSESRRSV